MDVEKWWAVFGRRMHDRRRVGRHGTAAVLLQVLPGACCLLFAGRSTTVPFQNQTNHVGNTDCCCCCGTLPCSDATAAAAGGGAAAHLCSCHVQ